MAQADRERWDKKHRERGFHPGVSAVLKRWADRLPRRGRALDVAGGSGRHSLWLAERGLSVRLLDIAPVAIAQAEEEARRRGLAIATAVLDLEEGSFPAGPWDLILSFHYLQRDLFPAFAAELASGGVLAFVQPTRKNLERHPRPSARFLLEEGELAGLIEGAGLAVLELREGWLEDGRHEAAALAIKE